VHNVLKKQILPIVYAYSRSYYDVWYNIDYFHCICSNCAMGTLISANVYTYRVYTCIMCSIIITMFGFKDKKGHTFNFKKITIMFFIKPLKRKINQRHMYFKCIYCQSCHSRVKSNALKTRVCPDISSAVHGGSRL